MLEKNRNSINYAIELTQIHVDELRVGMYVAELDRPWTDTPFLFQGFYLENEADVKTVKKYCEFVFIDKLRQSSAQTTGAEDTLYSKGGLKTSKSFKKHSGIDSDIQQGSKVHKQISTVVKSFMQNITLGKSVSVAVAKEVVAECVNQVVQAPDATMWLTQLKNADEYTAQHSMNVCIFAISLGKQLNLAIPDLNNLGLCGLMHDMGKMRIPLQVLNKPGRLTADELKIMNSHTTEGWKLLMSSHNMYDGAIDVAYTHHEKLDGTGYPRGLTGSSITPYARMVAIVDMYDAITSDRIYQKGRTHLDAMNIMTQAGGSHLDLGLTVKFIECLGIYPPGNLVEMSNGEVAVVIASNPQHKIKPQVVFLLDEEKQPQPRKRVDLATIAVDRIGQPYRIKRIVRHEEFGINLQAFHTSYFT